MILVIGYGNELRRDDGLGPRVAASLAGPGVRALAVRQLTPELAEEVATARLVVFVDARVNPPAATVEVMPKACELSESMAREKAT